MDSGQHRNAHTGSLLRCVGLRAAHFAHADNIGVETQGNIQQCDLIDTLALILAVAGLCVDDGVRHPAVTLTNKLEFP